MDNDGGGKKKQQQQQRTKKNNEQLFCLLLLVVVVKRDTTRRCDATTFCRDHHHPCRDFARSQYYPLPSTDVVVEAALEMCVRVLLAVVVAWGTR